MAFLDHRPLTPHPAAPPSAVAGVSCGVRWRDRGRWTLDFAVSAPPRALRLPPQAAPVRADDLWRTTCFELFLRRPGEAAYLEFNVSPSGQWSAWRFEGYRQGRSDLDIAPPRIISGDPERFSLSATLDDPRFSGDGPWLAGVTAVIEEASGALSYWGLAHPVSQPDFHHADGFVLALA